MTSSSLDFHNQLVAANGVDNATGWKSENSQAVRFDVFLSKVLDRQGTLLDYGCATGDLFFYARQRDYAFRYHGIDLNPNFINRLRERTVGETVSWCGNLCDPNFKLKRKFDYVFASGVFCHAPDPLFLLNRLWGATKKMLVVNFLNAAAVDSPLRTYSVEEVLDFQSSLSTSFEISVGYLKNDITLAVHRKFQGGRQCNICLEWKEMDEFTKGRGRYQGQCKACRNKWMREDRKKHPDKYRAIDMKGLYGISIEDYDLMVKAQSGVCAICKQREPSKYGRLHVDHCHLTGKIRGLLCGNCNTGIGKLGEDIEVLEAAIRYIEGGDAR